MAIPRGRQILVVEDDKSLRKLLADILEAEGYEVREAGNGRDAMNLLKGAREKVPDLIVLDLMLPKMNGWDFRAAISEDEALADIPLLVVSGIGPDLVSIAAEGHLHKPIDLNTFLSTVQRLATPKAQGPVLH